MRRHNPAFIPRNHRVEEALEQATQAMDLSAFEQLSWSFRGPTTISSIGIDMPSRPGQQPSLTARSVAPSLRQSQRR